MMANSYFHDVLTEIRKRYTGKRASILDVRNIEEKYHLCSIVNFRNDNCAFLRITSSGTGEIIFEDIVINIELIKPFTNSNELLFNSQKIMYELAYGLKIVDSSESLIEKIEEPSIEFQTMKEEIKKLIKERNELINKLDYATKRNQMSLFDDAN